MKTKTSEDCLWEKRRYEIAKEIYVRLLTHEDGEVRGFSFSHLNMTIEDCIMEADKLIEALRKDIECTDKQWMN